MSRSLMLLVVMFLTIVFMVSCSSGGGDIVTPSPTGERETISSAEGPTVMMGLWQFIADKNTGTIDIVKLRGADAIINVIGFMEPPPLTLMDLDWPNLNIDPINNTIDVGVILTHPIAGDDVFMGFDVRGVCFGPNVDNADGVTIIPGPEYFTGVPFGWQDGLLGAPDSFGNYTGNAGYKYFCDGLGPDDDLATFMSDPLNLDLRGSFGSGQTNSRNYNLSWDDPGDFLIFNYAIYANYDWPVGDPPISIDNFAITTANSAEAFCASVTEVANSLWYSAGSGGGLLSLDVEVWDWQGNITVTTAESVEAGVIAQTTGNALGAGGTSNSYLYEFVDMAASPTTIGDLDILITVTDSATFGESWFMDLMDPGHALYNTEIYQGFIHTANVIECPVPGLTGTLMGAGVIVGKSIPCTNLIDGPSLAISLWDGGTEYAGTNVTFVSGTELTADFDLTGVAFGTLLDVEITNGCGTSDTTPGAWEVFNFVAPISPYNIDVVTGAGTPTEIACSPTGDQVAVYYKTPNVWRIYTGTYGAYNQWQTHQSGYRQVPYADGSSWGLLLGETTGSCPTTEPIWSWDQWNGTMHYANYWFGSCTYDGKDIADSHGTTTTLLAMRMSSYWYFIRAYYYGGMSFYFTSSLSGVSPNTFTAFDIQPNMNSGWDLYILQNLTATTASVREVDYGGSYLGVTFGTELYAPVDITVDSVGNIYVLDIDSNGDCVIRVYDASGVYMGTSGALDDINVFSGTALRIDADTNTSPEEVHVLHSDGVTRFTMY